MSALTQSHCTYLHLRSQPLSMRTASNFKWSCWCLSLSDNSNSYPRTNCGVRHERTPGDGVCTHVVVNSFDDLRLQCLDLHVQHDQMSTPKPHPHLQTKTNEIQPPNSTVANKIVCGVHRRYLLVISQLHGATGVSKPCERKGLRVS